MKKLFAVLCLLLSGMGAFAQGSVVPAAYVTRTNTDLQNKFLYAELSYDVSSCSEYELRFRIVRNGTPFINRAKVHILNNIENMAVAGDTAVSEIVTGGFRLRVNLTNTTIAKAPGNTLEGSEPLNNADNLELCIDIFTKPAKCASCDVPGDTVVFTVKDIADDCPFAEKDENLLACNKRNNRQWEAFVRDPRTCLIYRAVQMPTGAWWMAQNLNFPKSGKCAGGAANCDKEGRIYTWYEAVTGMQHGDNLIYPKLTSNVSGPTGLCPPNWHVPTDLEWVALGIGTGSGAAVSDRWTAGTLKKLASFREGAVGAQSWNALTGIKDAQDRYGFNWTPSPFEAVEGVNGNAAVKYGAYWSAVDTAANAELPPINRIVAYDGSGRWAISPLFSDSLKGRRDSDYLPLRCVAGRGESVIEYEASTPQLGTSGKSCSGEVAAVVENPEAFFVLNFYVDGVLFEQHPSDSDILVDPYLVLVNPPGVTVRNYAVYARGASNEGFFGFPTTGSVIQVTQTLKGKVGHGSACPGNTTAGFIGL